MAQILSFFNSSCGLPVCLSGITTIHLPLSKEMADHDRRRRVFKKLKLGVGLGEDLHVDQEITSQRSHEITVSGDQSMSGETAVRDLDAIVHYLTSTSLNRTAKAA